MAEFCSNSAIFGLWWCPHGPTPTRAPTPQPALLLHMRGFCDALFSRTNGPSAKGEGLHPKESAGLCSLTHSRPSFFPNSVQLVSMVSASVAHIPTAIATVPGLGHQSTTPQALSLECVSKVVILLVLRPFWVILCAALDGLAHAKTPKGGPVSPTPFPLANARSVETAEESAPTCSLRS